MNNLKTFIDIVVTLTLWTYFTFGFLVFFSPFYLAAFLFAKNREIISQKLNHMFFSFFFILARLIIPRLKFRIDDDVNSIRSCIIVCNHVSYLDPIIFVSIFEKQKTIIKSSFLKVPIFGRMLKIAGYIFATDSGVYTESMVESMESLGGYLASGGNLFIFPEGTRARDGKIGSFGKGAFRIARRFNAPIKVLFIRNSDNLFQPGRFLFNTSIENEIRIELVGEIEPAKLGSGFDKKPSVSDMMKQVRALFENQMNLDSGKTEGPR